MRIILMCVVVLMLFAVLSTATYAWYSMTNRVSANSITFVAGSNSDGGDLAIGWSPDITNQYVLTFDVCNEKLSPMIPKERAELGQTSYDSFLFFNSTTQALNEYGEWISNMVGTNAAPYTLTGSNNGAANKQGYFYLINKNRSLNLKIVLNYDITGELQEKLRIAFFTGDNPSSTVLRGILARNEDIHYGQINAGDKISDTQVMADVFTRTGTLTFDIPANRYVAVRLTAWLDGVDMSDVDGDKSTLFSLQFNGELY